MTLAERLRRVVDGLPSGSAVSLPVDVLREWLDEEPGKTEQPGQDEPLVDLTVQDVADLLDRSASTVRWWCQDGTLSGAYKLRSREWRIPRQALRDLRNGQEDGRPRLAKRHAPLDAYKEEG